MKTPVKIVVFAFLIIMIFYTYYQYLVGNPFFDDISPIIPTVFFLVIAVTAVFAVFKKK
jgi:hypothetical protein